MPMRKIDVVDLERDYYEILGVSCTATFKEVKKARDDKALAYQLNKNNGESMQDEMKAVNEAFEVLEDAELRVEYNEKMRLPPPPDNRNKAGDWNEKRQEKNNSHFMPNDVVPNDQPWPRPPPPKTDGLGMSRYDRFGRKPYANEADRPDAAAAREAGFEAWMVRIEKRKEFAREHGLLGPDGRWIGNLKPER